MARAAHIRSSSSGRRPFPGGSFRLLAIFPCEGRGPASPPLSTCGLCLSLSAWSAAGGAFLLFLANFVSILIVALLVFGCAGLGRSADIKTWKAWRRRFAPTALVFLVIAFVMTKSLTRIILVKQIERGIHEQLVAEFSADPAVDLDDFKYNLGQDRVELLANVRAPRVIPPSRVTTLQTTISKAIGYPVDLVVRTTLGHDVSPLGSVLQVRRPDLSGAFLSRRPEGAHGVESLAAQVIREHFESTAGFELTNVEYGIGKRGNGVILAYVDALSNLPRNEILSIESELRERLNRPKLTFAVRLNIAEIESSHGPFLADWTDWSGLSEDEYESLTSYEQVVKKAVTDLAPIEVRNVHFRLDEGQLDVLVDVSGPNPVTPEDAKRLEEILCLQLKRPVKVRLWYRNDFIAAADGYTSFEAFSTPGLTERERALQAIFGSSQSRSATKNGP